MSYYLWCSRSCQGKVLSRVRCLVLRRLTAETGPWTGTPSPSMKKPSLMCLHPTATCPSTVPPWDTRRITPSPQTVSMICKSDSELQGQICALLLGPWDRGGHLKGIILPQRKATPTECLRLLSPGTSQLWLETETLNSPTFWPWQAKKWTKCSKK